MDGTVFQLTCWNNASVILVNTFDFSAPPISIIFFFAAFICAELGSNPASFNAKYDFTEALRFESPP